MTPVPLTAAEIREKTFKILESYGVSLESAIQELAHIAERCGTPEDCAGDGVKSLDYLEAITAYCMDRSTERRLTVEEARSSLTGNRLPTPKTNWDRLRIGNIFTGIIRDNGCSELYGRWQDVSYWTRQALGMDATEDQYRAFFVDLCKKHKSGEGIPHRPDPFGGKKER